MKYIKILFLIVLMPMLLSGCISYTGCKIEPYHLDTMYLSNYIDKNGQTFKAHYDTIKQECLYSDDITIQFFEDRTFIFKEFDKYHIGTYTYINGLTKTLVFLTFSDGTKGNATCSERLFKGIIKWYKVTLQVFEKEYVFTDECEFKRDGEPYGKVGEFIVEILKDKRYSDQFYHLSEPIWLIKGSIEFRDNEYWFVSSEYKEKNYLSEYDIERCGPKNLSTADKIYTYEVFLSDNSVRRGDNVLREGECFATLDKRVTDDEVCYAVWYYQPLFDTLYPWAKDLKQKDIQTLEIKCQNNVQVDNQHDFNFIKQNKYENSNNKLEEFCLFLKNCCLVKEKTVLERIAQYEKDNYDDYKATFIIKTNDSEFEIVYFDYAIERFFFVDGEFYTDCTKKVYHYTIYAPYVAFNEKTAVLYFADNLDVAIKEYQNFDIYFKFYYTYKGDWQFKYILKIGEETLYLIDERHFLWLKEGQVDENNNPYEWVYEICGDIDFSEIFEEYPI